MRLPKYFNPHFAIDATRTVSRKTLQVQNDVRNGVEPGREADGVGRSSDEVEGLHIKLEEIISKRLKLKRVLTPSDEPRSSKRSKLIEEGERQLVEPEQTPEPVTFRLVSKSLPPRAVYLTPKPPKAVLVKEPPCEDTEEELKERTYRSTLSAVDLERINHMFPVVGEWKPPQPLKTTSRSYTTIAPLLLLEIPRIEPLPLPWMNQRLNIPPKPSPHQSLAKATCCPTVLAAVPLHHDSERKEGRRRRGKPKNKNRLVP